MIKTIQLILKRISTNARTVIKNAVPCCTLPCRSEPFKHVEIAIPNEMTKAIIVNGIGNCNFPAEPHALVCSLYTYPKGQTLTHVFLKR